jgi:hypothetical protein
MGGLLSKIFGTDKAVSDAGDIAKTITTGVVKGMDALVFTDEEKESMSQDKMRIISDLIIKLQDQFTPRAITRRIIAVLFSTAYMVAYYISLFIVGWEYIKDRATGEETIALIIKLTEAFGLGAIILTIIIFYFGYYGITKIMEKK